MTSPAPGPTIYGELHADGGHIVVMFAGADTDLPMAGQLLNTLVPHFSVIKDEQGAAIPNVLKVPTSWAAVVQLASTFGAAWRTGPALTEWLQRELAARMNLDGGLTVAPPAGWTPFPWQVEGARLIAATGSAYINDDPGCGKTASTVLGVVERAAAGHEVFPAIVVCPAKGMQEAWVREFNLLAPWLRVVKWVGKNVEHRRKMAGYHDVYVVSYETARRDAQDDTKKRSPLVWLHAKTLIVDESHRIKQAGAAQTRAVKRLARHAENFIALTGTPIAKSPRDITSTLECLDHGAWPSAERFEQRFCMMDRTANEYQASNLGLRPQMAAEFWLCLQGQYRRVAKEDVLAELPPKRHTVEYVDMPQPWRGYYDRYERDMLTELPGCTEEMDAFTVLEQLRHLTTLASSPGDLRVETKIVDDPDTGLPVEKRSQHIDLKDTPRGWKIDKLIAIMGRYPGQAVITAAPSRQLMLLAGARAAAEGYRVGYIVGGQTDRKRQAAIDAFQDGDLDLICVSTAAGGVGITLTAASVMVFLQRPWSLIESDQMESRAHRIGSERHEQIDIIDVVTRGTVEHRVREVLKERAGAAADFLKDPRIIAQCLGGASVTKIYPRKEAS